MDSTRFDRWTRSLAASPPSRRTLLRTLAGAALGGALGLVGLREAAAACRLVQQTCDAGRHCCPGARCTHGRCRCKESQNFFACNGPGTRCVNIATSETHCGGCDRPCEGNEICLNGGCVNACKDGLRDELETDVDCGGPDCPPCANGLKCDEDADCTSDFCDADGTCQDPHSCRDGVKNGRETDVDCGGPGCPGCADRRACFINADCQNNFCDRSADPNQAGVCGLKPTCANGKKDGDETDVDCGGSSCPRCEFGEKCNSAADCQGIMQCVNRAGDGSDKKFCVECTNDDICNAVSGGDRPTCVGYQCRALGGTCSAGQDVCKTGPDRCGGDQCGSCHTTTGGATVCGFEVDPNGGCDNPCTSSTQCVNRFGPGAFCIKDTGNFCGCNSCAFPC